MSYKVLFVDDERQILKALKRLFHKSGFESFYASSGEEALGIMEKESIDMIVSDIRMPNMNGYELLKIVKEKYPLTIRVALSGYTDKFKIYNALESNLIKFYLFKPWNNDDLKRLINKLLNLKDTLENVKVLNLVSNIDELPSVPKLYYKINRLIDEDAGMSEIASTIEQDQSIAANILRISNSAFYSNKTGSVKEAIMFIGLLNVKNIILANNVLRSTKSSGKAFSQLADHSIMVNSLSQGIYQNFLDKKVPNTYASAGLLHDIGKIVFYEHFSQDYSNLHMERKTYPDFNTIQLEKVTFGLTHEEIGAYLLDWWGIPLGIVESALFHHTPSNPNIINKEIVAVTHLADYYSKVVNKDPVVTDTLDLAVFDHLKIDKVAFENWIYKKKI